MAKMDQGCKLILKNVKIKSIFDSYPKSKEISISMTFQKNEE